MSLTSFYYHYQKFTSHHISSISINLVQHFVFYDERDVFEAIPSSNAGTGQDLRSMQTCGIMYFNKPHVMLHKYGPIKLKGIKHVICTIEPENSLMHHLPCSANQKQVIDPVESQKRVWSDEFVRSCGSTLFHVKTLAHSQQADNIKRSFYRLRTEKCYNYGCYIRKLHEHAIKVANERTSMSKTRSSLIDM
ncbi:hypothetical protein VCUG_02380 [Vavraia culicis subsp. floridensis]|uniref:Uncharacterized protein n=1 Tax=Vavraia culicis (isolate floridensis) TaxID=948595 RepID=L2GSR8_VAVCU|nr:uncharacterized protein VCUG_02380 [Vavraia culicis subsp. floridensis]ELA46145.1 hypothetical protein VCUG_02380 [Vavraia culicis subsp. floridensis]